MKLDTITMDRTEARRAFLDYRRAVHERHDAEDAQIMRGYRELARGTQLIRLSETIAAGGQDDEGLPRLAVADAHEPWAWLQRGCSGAVTFLPCRRGDLHHSRRRGIYRMPAGTLPAHNLAGRPTWQCEAEHGDGFGRRRARRAMVPKVPPALRPAHHLRNYTILWEVEQWATDPQPPRDPALLKRIGGDLYAVLAVWDLTDLERAVLAGRTHG